VRRRFTLNEDGDLADSHGYVLPMRVFAQSRMVGVVLEAPASTFREVGEPTEGTEGSDVDVLPSTETTERRPRKPHDERILRVWDAYVATMKPRHAVLDPQARTMIREALNVASEGECIGAIRGCAKSRFHMGDNDRHKKFNALSQILRGKRGIRTTREQIDLMLTYDEATVSEELPSGVLAEVEKAKGIVQRYGYFTNNDQAADLVRAATAVLAEHGIDVVRTMGTLQGEPIVESIVFSDGVNSSSVQVLRHD
jgi:hypothetical protein